MAMTLDWRPADARREVVRLCHAGLDPDTLRNSVIGQLHRVLEFDAWCWTTADPATGLITGATGRNLPADKTQRFFEIEYVEPDFTKWSELARRRVPVGALGRATGGRFERSARFREIFGPAGIGEDLRAALTIGGSTWGYLGLHRDPARPFGDHEAAYLAGLTRHLAEGLRTALLLGGLDLDDDAGPGVLLVGDDLRVRSVSPRAVELMAEIRTRRSAGGGPLRDAGGEGDGVMVPDAVAAVVALLLRLERGDAEGADDAEGANRSGPVGSPAMPRA